MRAFIVCLLMLCSMPAYAELIDGPANVRSSPQGMHVLSLNNNVPVEVSLETYNSSWKMIGFFAVVDKTDIDREKMVLNDGVTLYNPKGDVIGRTHNVVDLDNMLWPPDERNGRYSAGVIAYTWIKNIQEKSIVENDLEKLINERKGPVTLDMLKPHLKAFYYRPWFEKDGFSSYMVHEVWMEDPSPGARVILILHDDRLVSVIHSREIDMKADRSQDVLHYKMVYPDKISEELRRELEDCFLDILRKAD